MEKRKPLSLITEWLLKITVIIYLFFMFFPPGVVDIYTGEFWGIFVNVLYFILFITISLLVVIPTKHPFRIICFFVIGVTAFLKTLHIIYESGFDSTISVYLLLFIIPVFYMARIYLNRKRG